MIAKLTVEELQELFGDLKDETLWPDSRIATTIVELAAGRTCFMASDECSFGELSQVQIYRIYHGEHQFVTCRLHADLFRLIEGEKVKIAQLIELTAEFKVVLKEREDRRRQQAEETARFREYLRRHIAARDRVALELVEDSHVDIRIEKMSPEQITATKARVNSMAAARPTVVRLAAGRRS